MAPAIKKSRLFVAGLCLVSGLVWLAACHTPLTGGAAAPAPMAAATPPPAIPPDDAALKQYHETVEPILEQRCYACHGDGESRAGVAFDKLKTADQILHNPDLWLKVLKNTRSHLMPPAKHDPPTPGQQLALESWIKTAGFGLNPNQPDPGRVTVRRLNRTEYRNTIRDLIGVEVNVDDTLAADDIGYGFDNIADVLTLSPMRMEKFLEAAQAIVRKGVPTASRAIGDDFVAGKDFLTADGAKNGDPISFYDDRAVSHTYTMPAAGDYRVVLTTMVDGNAAKDPGLCTVTGLADGKEFYRQEHHWADCEFFHSEKVVHLGPGQHQFTFHLQPKLAPEEQVTPKMDYKLLTVEVQGPLDPKDWQPPPTYARFYPRPEAPTDPAARRAYAREVIARFASKAYRRPVSTATLDRLVNIAEGIYSIPGTTFEVGVSRAIVAILASPRFLFRIEEGESAAPGQQVASLDEYALASRLSYFLWSSLPDDELFQLAARGELRRNLAAQVKRMLADPKSAAFVENFTGQWLRSREVVNTPLNRPVIFAREDIVLPNNAPTDVSAASRLAMKQEAEAYFGYVAHENRSVLELLDSNYTFVNQQLAGYYAMPAGTATGPELRKVILPPDDPRGGGVLTMGSVLAVTSNPTRTSPVKRGKWILENILGAPPAPPPPAVPSLEETEKKLVDHVPTQRETLALHRQDPVCASCHDRMDPLGLALENFNALGLYRTRELGQPVDATGQLFTGESFKTVRELKHILAAEHPDEFYRTLTEKLLIYALGRGVEYYDVPAVDQIVARLDRTDGRFEELLLGLVESAPFQQRRIAPAPLTPEAKPALVAAEATPTP